MKLTTDFDRGQNALLRRGRLSAAQPNTCSCEAIAERILEGESPAQLHKWAFHVQPPKFLKAFLHTFTANPTRAHSPFLLVPFSQSASEGVPERGGGPETGQFGQHSFGSLDRSAATGGPEDCTHAVLFDAILATDRTGYLTLLQNWGISLPNVGDSRGQGLLHWAVQRQAADCVQELFSLGHSAQRWALAKDKRGLTPVHLAAVQDSPRMLKMILAELGQTDLQSAATDVDGMNPLHHAAGAGSATCCELVLADEWQLPVDLRDRRGRTPLHHAAWCKFAANVLRLLATKKGIAASARDDRGWTPLHTAVVANNAPVLRTLLRELGAEPQIFDHDSRTPLHYAALHDRPELARLLIECGATNDTRDRFNVTPAHYASSYETLRAILDTPYRTADEGAEDKEDGQVLFGVSGEGIMMRKLSTRAEPQPLDGEGRTPFMWAVIAQNQQLVQQMLADPRMDSGRLVTAKDAFKRTPLHLAALTGNLEICKLLVNEGHHLNVNDGDEYGATPEHLAAGQGNSEVVLWFGYIRGGHAQPPLDIMDRTPFLYACLSGQASTIEAMLRSLRVEPDHVDSLGCSALHCAVVSGSLHCVKALVESNRGFDLHLRDKDERSALDIAREQQLPHIAQYLEAKMAE